MTVDVDVRTKGGRGGAVDVEFGDSLSKPSPVLLVGLTACLAAIVYGIVALSLPAPWIMPDELIYSELAKSVGGGSLPSVRGEVTFGYGLIYPTLIAPAWSVFDDPADAYRAAKAVNAILMCSAAFPAYFLARRFVSEKGSLLVSAFSVFIPSMLYSGTLLIEVVLYPLFLLALLGVVASIQNPTRRNQLLAIAGIGLACLAKPLAVVLVPVYLLTVLHLGLLDRRRSGTVRGRASAHSTAFGVLGIAGVALIVAPGVRGNPDAVLGVYGVVLGNIDLSGAAIWFLRHLAVLDLYVAVVPFAATAVLVISAIRGRARDPRLEEFAVLATWTIGAILAAVAAYSSKPLAGAEGYLPSEARLHERNIFVLAPILLIGLARFIEGERGWPRRLVLGSTSIAVLLPLALPLERLTRNANFQALSIIPWAADGIRGVWPATFVPVAALAAFVVLRAGRRSSRLPWVFVGVMFSLTTVAAHASMSQPSGGAANPKGVGYDTRWIDDSVPPGSTVMVLWVAPPTEAGVDFETAYRTVWLGEFFNRSVGKVVEVGYPMPYDLPHARAALVDGVLRSTSGTPIRAHYLLAPCWVVVRGGRVVGGDPRVPAHAYRLTPGPIHLAEPSRGDPACEDYSISGDASRPKPRSSSPVRRSSEGR